MQDFKAGYILGGTPRNIPFVELIAASVKTIELNGQQIDPATVIDGNRIRIDALAATNELTIIARCIYSRSGEGLHRFIDPVDKRSTSTPSSRRPTRSWPTPASTSPASRLSS